MKKVLMLILFISYVSADPVITQEMIYDGMLNGVKGMYKEITGQNDQAHEDNCKIEYEKLYARNSQHLKQVKEENIKLREIARVNNVQHEEMRINHIEVRKNGKCSIKYHDYFKASNHEISQITKENNHIKLLLSKKNINYTPLLKTTTVSYAKKEETVTLSEREKAKEELKRQMGL